LDVHRAGVADLPGPTKVWHSAVNLFADPFYRKSPNDQGIGWNILYSLQRVGIGFGLAAAIGIPLGFVLGRFGFLNAMASPVINLLRPSRRSRGCRSVCSCSRQRTLRRSG
jgi:nitrate/nitrite transport system permease protein